MKELSVEEKAKRYDEALIRGSKLWESDMITRENYEYIFPEVKESEDERIRKAIYNCVKWFGFDSCFFKDVSQEECLAWIEKQCEKGTNGNERKTSIPEPPLTIKRAKEVMGIKQDDAWSEEDDRMYNIIVSYIPQHLTAESYTACINWLKSFKDRVQPQPKQEWSEEDEANSSYICAALDCYYRIREERNNTNGQEDLDKARNWLYNRLKFLRPQNTWFPSDEQMEALDDVISSRDIRYDVLSELWKDLNKLK